MRLDRHRPDTGSNYRPRAFPSGGPKGGPALWRPCDGYDEEFSLCAMIVQCPPFRKSEAESRRTLFSVVKDWGGRRGLNPRHSVPQTDALPAELLPPLTDNKHLTLLFGLRKRGSMGQPRQLYRQSERELRPRHAGRTGDEDAWVLFCPLDIMSYRAYLICYGLARRLL